MNVSVVKMEVYHKINNVFVQKCMSIIIKNNNVF